MAEQRSVRNVVQRQCGSNIAVEAKRVCPFFTLFGVFVLFFSHIHPHARVFGTQMFDLIEEGGNQPIVLSLWTSLLNPPPTIAL